MFVDQGLEVLLGHMNVVGQSIAFIGWDKVKKEFTLLPLSPSLIQRSTSDRF
jgi:hypothetical protein